MRKQNKYDRKGDKEMDELLEVLEGVKPEVDFVNEKALVDDEILDSFDIIAILHEINSAFEVGITVADLLPENFNSLEAIWELVQKAKEA